MEQMLTESQTLPLYTLYILVFSLTCAQVLVLYFLSASHTAPQGLGLFTVYFMASLTGWILFALQQGQAAGALGVDPATVVALLNAYLLFLACGQRAGIQRGRAVVGVLCLAAAFSAFYLSAQRMFTVQLVGCALLWAAAGVISAQRGWRQANVGDGLIAGAGLGLAAGLAWLALKGGQPGRDQQLALALYACAHALVAVGFLGSALLEYQQQLSQLATRDSLTRLFNRRGLEEALHLTLAAAARHNTRTSAVLVDIDQFSRINDSFGAETGDAVLQQVAGLLQDQCRGSDVAARIGGEQFLLVLPNADGEAARIVAERLRRAVSDSVFRAERQPVAVSVSAGVATLEGTTTVDELALAGARALQVARREGHNRVAVVDQQTHLFRTGAAPEGV
ncbi:GGDEF domain-containing protein [Parahaliea mediterranea]|uniref:GGDEF domain-containing protein n=1 Tax=Parahaliea mediterranea TaxID=651086 RepID=UPI000E2E8DB9|nr:GGDEF domain-containing protein [Parahaliea mediterranea]